MQTPVILSLTLGSAVAICDPSIDLSALVVPARLVLTGIDQSLPAAKTSLPIQSFAKVGNAWNINLTAPFANASAAGVTARIHTSFTASGFALWDTGDTVHKALLNDNAETMEAQVASLQAIANTMVTNDGRVDSRVDYLRSLTERLIPQSAFTFTGGVHNGQQGHLPDGSGHYPTQYLRDTAMAMRDHPAAYTPAQVLALIDLFFATQDSSTGCIYDAITSTGVVQVPGGDVGHLTSHAAQDNIFELIDACYTHYQMTGTTTAYTTYESKLPAALAYVGVQNHLVYNTPGIADPKVGVGFQDSIMVTGYDLACSVYRYRAYGQLAQLATAAGEAANAAAYSAEQALIPAALHTYLWDASRGLYRTGSVDNQAHSVAWSAYAVYTGAAYASDITPICNALLAMRPGQSLGAAGTTCYQGGQVSHIPQDEYFERTRDLSFGNFSRGNYQNGAFWSSFTGWVAFCLSKVSQVQADNLMNELIARFQAQGALQPYEAENTANGYVGDTLYIISTTLPLAYWRGRGLLPAGLGAYSAVTGGSSQFPVPTLYQKPYDTTTTQAGMALGFNTTPRIFWSTGTPSQGWEVDNNAGVMRWVYGGTGGIVVAELLSDRFDLRVPFVGAVNEALVFSGVQVGYNPANGVGCILIGDNTPAHTFKLDVTANGLRFISNGALQAVLSNGGVGFTGPVTESPNAPGAQLGINPANNAGNLILSDGTHTFKMDVTSAGLRFIANGTLLGELDFSGNFKAHGAVSGAAL